MYRSDTLHAALDQEAHVVMLVENDGTISFLNREWTLSAHRDSAPGGCDPKAVLGRPYLDFVAGAIRPHVAEAFNRAAALSPGFDSVWLHGECNTSTLRRLLTTRISPLWEQGGEGNAAGLLVHHQLRVVGALDAHYALVEHAIDALRDDRQLIVQCGCCRRVREPQSGRWSMCVALLQVSAKDTSHGLCELCVETYYPPG